MLRSALVRYPLREKVGCPDLRKLAELCWNRTGVPKTLDSACKCDQGVGRGGHTHSAEVRVNL